MSKNTISCAFCGKKFSLPDNAGAPNRIEATPELRAHIEVCKRHPLGKANRRIRELKAELDEMETLYNNACDEAQYGEQNKG